MRSILRLSSVRFSLRTSTEVLQSSLVILPLIARPPSLRSNSSSLARKLHSGSRNLRSNSPTASSPSGDWTCPRRFRLRARLCSLSRALRRGATHVLQQRCQASAHSRARSSYTVRNSHARRHSRLRGSAGRTNLGNGVSAMRTPSKCRAI